MLKSFDLIRNRGRCRGEWAIRVESIDIVFPLRSEFISCSYSALLLGVIHSLILRILTLVRCLSWPLCAHPLRLFLHLLKFSRSCLLIQYWIWKCFLIVKLATLVDICTMNVLMKSSKCHFTNFDLLRIALFQLLNLSIRV